MKHDAFRKGRFQTFFAERSIALGNTGYVVYRGEQILFDGTTVHFDGHSFEFPALRAAIKGDWLAICRPSGNMWEWLRHPTL